MTDEEAVARAIFEVDRDFHDEPLPERHFKVAIAQYQARARAAIAAMRVWRKMTTAELRALPPNGSFPALIYLDGHISLPCDPWSLPPETLADALFQPLPEPPK